MGNPFKALNKIIGYLQLGILDGIYIYGDNEVKIAFALSYIQRHVPEIPIYYKRCADVKINITTPCIIVGYDEAFKDNENICSIKLPRKYDHQVLPWDNPEAATTCK